MYNLTFHTPYDQHIKKRVMGSHIRQHAQKSIISSFPEPTHFNNVHLGDGKLIEKFPKRNK